MTTTRPSRLDPVALAPGALAGDAVAHLAARPHTPRAPAQPAQATLLALVAHARGVSSIARAAFAAQCEALPRSDRVLLIRTCHRVELYVAVGPRPVAPARAADAAAVPAAQEAAAVAAAAQVAATLPAGGLLLTDADAARHLIGVACGLDSAVLGEDQVLHQVRAAYTAHRARGSLDPVLDRLVQVALGAGKRARGWFVGPRRSLGDAALDEIERHAGPLDGVPILVVGAGSMGRLAAKAADRRGARVTIANRNPQRAQQLARELGAAAHDPGTAVPPATGVIVALSGPWELPTGDADALADADDTVVVDLSSPPAVAPPLQRRLGPRFVSIDDLAWGPQDELPGGLSNRLEQLVSDSGGEFCRWLRGRESVPAVQALTGAAEARREQEMQWLLRRLPALPEAERVVVEQMTRRLVAGLLHAPRSALRLDETGDLGRAAYQLFDL